MWNLSTPQADGQTELPTSQGLRPEPEVEQAASHTHAPCLPPCPVCTRLWKRWAPRVGTCQMLGISEPAEFGSLPLAPWPGNSGSRARISKYSCCELAGLKVTAKIQCRGRSQSHHSHLDSCTDLGKTASAPSLQGQSFSSTFGGLAGGPPWLLSQK